MPSSPADRRHPHEPPLAVRVVGRRVEVRGDLDALTAPDLDDALRRAAIAPTHDGRRDVVIEATGIRVLAAAGVRPILRAARALRAGGRVVVRSPSRTVRRVLRLTTGDEIVVTPGALDGDDGRSATRLSRRPSRAPRRSSLLRRRRPGAG